MLGPQPLAEHPQAFMQTSNDELPRLTKFSTHPSAAPATMLSSDLPAREQVPSASRLPHGPVASTLTRDNGLSGDLVDNWRDYCDKQRETFDAERKLWAVERKLLSAQISQLQNELMIASSKLKQLELSNGTSLIENGDSKYPNTRKAPLETEEATKEGSSDEHLSNPKVHFPSDAAELLHDIPEINDTPNSQNGEGIILDAGSNEIDPEVILDSKEYDLPSVETLRVLHAQERPLSPPATASLLSPPPESYRRFAGHTPGGSMSGRDFFDQETPKALRPMLSDKTNATDAQEDMPLKGPLGLGAEPESTPDILHTLDEKLQDVKDHPEQLTPAVLVGEQTVTNGKLSGNFKDEPPSSSTVLQLATEKSTATSDTNVYEQVVDGPKLRVKRSMNFGAPLGSLNPPFA